MEVTTNSSITPFVPYYLGGSNFSAQEKALVLSLVVPIITFTISANFFVIFVISTVPALKTPSNLYLLSLALTDFLSGLLSMPVACYYNVVGVWQFGVIGCKTYSCFAYLLNASSAYHLAAIAIDRYRAITHPLGYGLDRNFGKTLLAIAIVWSLSLVNTATPYVFDWGMTWPEKFERDTPCAFPQDLPYNITTGSLCISAPFLVIGAVYGRLYFLTRERSNRKIQQLVAAKKSSIITWRDHSVPENVENHPMCSGTEIDKCERRREHCISDENDARNIDSRALFENGKIIPHHKCICNGNVIELGENISEVRSNDRADGDVGKCESIESRAADKDVKDGNVLCANCVNGAGVNEIVNKERTSFEKQFGHQRKRRREEEERDGSSCQGAKPCDDPRRRDFDRICHGDFSQTCPVGNKETFTLEAELSREQEVRIAFHIKKERRALRVTTIIVCTYLICLVPGWIVMLVMTMYPSVEVRRWIIMVTYWLYYANSACNPVVYTIFNVDFRKALRKILQRNYIQHN